MANETTRPCLPTTSGKRCEPDVVEYASSRATCDHGRGQPPDFISGPTAIELNCAAITSARSAPSAAASLPSEEQSMPAAMLAIVVWMCAGRSSRVRGGSISVFRWRCLNPSGPRALKIVVRTRCPCGKTRITSRADHPSLEGPATPRRPIVSKSEASSVSGAVVAPPLADRTVGDVMNPGIVSCHQDATIGSVARIMATHHVHCVAIMNLARDESGELVVWGIISDRDVIRGGIEVGPYVDAASVARAAGGHREARPLPPRGR